MNEPLNQDAIRIGVASSSIIYKVMKGFKYSWKTLVADLIAGVIIAIYGVPYLAHLYNIPTTGENSIIFVAALFSGRLVNKAGKWLDDKLEHI